MTFHINRFQIISKNPNELAIELCLASVDNNVIKEFYKNNSVPLCNEEEFGMFSDVRRPGRNRNGRKKKFKLKKTKKNKTKNKNKKNKRRKKNGNKISGSSVYLSDTNPRRVITSRHHPWQCSLRFQGFRGRHRCGVTLLSGPTEESPSDPFVLVGAAHCNYICKDRVTGYPLETCCCRPETVAGSCRRNNPYSASSPFCPENPDDAEFTLADPEDLVIICGEFDTDVELIWWSYEPEEVFEIVEIINHPQYKPNEVNEKINIIIINLNFSGQ